MEEAGKILSSVLKKRCRHGDSAVADALVPFWPRLAGKPIARHSMPVGFSQGILFLASNSSSWSQQLRQMAEEIRAAVNSFLGEARVKKVQVRYVPGLSPPGDGDPIPMVERGHGNLETGIVEFQAESPEPSQKLDPETAQVVARSFSKYFARGSKRMA